MVCNVWLKTLFRVGVVILSIGGLFHLGVLLYFIYKEWYTKKGLWQDILLMHQCTKLRLLKAYEYLAFSFVLLMIASICLYHWSVLQGFTGSHYAIYSVLTSVTLLGTRGFLYNLCYRHEYGIKLLLFVLRSLLHVPALTKCGLQVCLEAIKTLSKILLLLTAITLLANKELYEPLKMPSYRFGFIVLLSGLCVSYIGLPQNWLQLALFCFNFYIGFLYFCWMFIMNTQIIMTDVMKQCYHYNYDPIYMADLLQSPILNLLTRTTTLITLSIALQS